MIHSHLHTCFSAKDSLVRVKDLVKAAKERGYKALTITDHGSIGGTLDFYDECIANDIKPLIGCEFYLKSEIKLTTNPQERMHIIVICKNKTGWNNLLKLSKLSHINSHYVPLTSFEDLKNHSEGLICTTACFAGPLAMPIMNSRPDLALENLETLKSIFKDDLYLELQPNSLPSQQTINNSIYKMAIEHNLPYIIGIDTHYMSKEEAKAQETLLGINMRSTILDPVKSVEAESKEDDGTGAKKRYRFAFSSHDFWFMTEEELYKMWDDNHKEIGRGVEDGEHPHLIALAKALAYGEEMADKVEKFSIYPDRSKLNMVYDMTSVKDEEFNKFMEIDVEHKDQPLSLKLLRYLCHKGIKEKGILDKPNAKEYIDRVKHELKDIEEANIYDYLLIVYDLMKWCRENSIGTGTARGSSSGSLCTYLIGVHEVDPMQYGLLWERFYNAGRKGSMPDIDMDFGSLTRNLVIEYLVSKYGEERTSMICNFSFFRPKSTFKAVCKYYGVSYDVVNEALKDGRHIEDDDDMEQDDDINLSSIKKEMQELFTIKSVKELLDINPYAEDIKRDCMAIVGCVSNKSVHASGIVITSSQLDELCPMMTNKSKNEAMKSISQTTEWDMKMLDRAGFMKLDILGLKTVDIINQAIKSINDPNHTMHSWKALDKNDPEVLNLFTTGQTSGVFQFDYGKELQRLCLEFRPKSFADICALTALGRPGAKMFLEQYMRNRSKADHEIQLEDPLLKPILQETNYVLAYQEQQMAIAKDLCGFNLKEADDLRKIIAKKQESKIPAMKEKFIAGYIDRVAGEPPDDRNQDDGCWAEACFVHGEEYKSASETAIKIWDTYFSNCEYLFNKSHAVAYSFNSYATAYYKRYYPVEFMSAVIDANNDGKREDIVPYIHECMRMKIPIVTPNIRYSPAITWGNKEYKKIYLGLNTIKDMSNSVASKFQQKGDNELIDTLFNLPKAQYEAMILSGACDGLIKGVNRRSLFETVQAYHKLKADWAEYNKKLKDYHSKCEIAMAKGKKTSAKPPKMPEQEITKSYEFPKSDLTDFTLQEKIAHEIEYLGYSPIDPDFKYMPYILGTTIHSYRQKETLNNNDVVFVYGEITDVKEKKTANGNNMYSLRIQPKTMQYGFYATCWDNKYNKEEMIIGAKFIFRMKVNDYIGKDKKLVKGFNVMDYRKAEEIWK